jgi:predicted ArsR family transcriptional regulator
MANWFERMADGTRGQLLVLLRRSKRSINDLAGRLGISDNAVRMHVAALQRDGMVESAGAERATGGKPAQLFQITPAAEELFPKAYALVLGEVIRVLEQQQGRDAVVRLLRDVGMRAAASHRDPGLDPDARVQQAASALRGLGGDVEVERRGPEWVIQGYGCPLSAVASDHAEVCCLAESLVAEITGMPTTEFCARGDRPRCAFRISEGTA